MSASGVSLTRMYTINKQLVEMYVQFGKADMRGGRYESAMKNLCGAIKMKPNNVEVAYLFEEYLMCVRHIFNAGCVLC